MNRIVTNILAILTPREKKTLQVQIFFNILISLLDIVFIGLILLMVSVYSGELKADSTRLPSEILDQNSLLLVSLTFVLFSLKNLVAYHITRLQYTFIYSVASRISDDNLKNYFDKHYDAYVHTDSSINMRHISQTPIEFSHYILSSLQHIITQGILIIFAITAIVIYNASLFVLLLLLLSPPVVFTAVMIRKKLSVAKANAKETSEKNMQYLQESLSAYVESNIYGKNSFFRRRYHSYQALLNQYLADQQIIQALPARLIEVFALLGFFILILLNKFYDGDYSISLLTIGIFMAASYKIIPGIVKILNSLGHIHAYMFTIDELLKEAKFESTNDILSPTQIKSIEFNQVGFNYGDKSILNNFNLEILPGDFIGITGISGRGKTTLVNLLLGFLEPQEGYIIINRSSRGNEKIKGAWTRISYVKQQVFILHDTFLKNITLSDDIPDTMRLNESLRISGASELLGQLPNGLKEVIRENGKNLSGGQRQRIVLARALYKDFDLLLLDEPFNELDENSARKILSELHLIAENGKMIIIICHDTKGLELCNKLISLE